MSNSLGYHGAHQAPLYVGIPQARILEWDAMPSSRSSQPRSPALQVDSLSSEPLGKLWLNAPWMLEWVAYPLSRGSSWPWNWTGVSCIPGRFFTSWSKGNISVDSTPGPESQAMCTTEMAVGSVLCQEQHPSVLEEYLCAVAQIFSPLFFHLYCNDFVSALFSTISELCCWTARPSGMHYHNRLISTA